MDVPRDDLPQPQAIKADASSPQRMGRVAVHRSAWWTYGLAVVLTLITLLVRFSISDWTGGRPMPIIFLLPIILASYVGGLRPGLLATALSALFTKYFLMKPVHSFAFGQSFDSGAWILWITLIVSGVLTSVLNEALLRGRRRAEAKEEIQSQTLMETKRTLTQARAFLEAAPDAMVITNQAGEIVQLNLQAEKAFGYERRELLGHPMLKVLPKWAGTKGNPTGRPAGQEIFAHRKNGSKFPVEMASGPLETPEGSLWINTIRDTTERKQAEEALSNVLRHASTIIMRFAIEAPEGWEQRGPEWAAANFRWETQFYDTATALEVLPVEIPPGEDFSHAWRRAKHRDDQGHMGLTAHRALLAGASSWQQEFRCLNRHGRLHWFNQVASIEPVGHGRWQVTTVNRDITKRKLVEETLRASVDRLVRQESGLISLSRKEVLPNGDLLAALRRITEVSAKTLDVARVSVWRYSQDRRVICCVDSYELHENRHSEGEELAVTDYPAYFQALVERDVIVADDACADAQTCEFAANYLEPLGITSMMDAPIQFKGVLDGVVCHEHIGPQRSWTSDERTFAVAVANSVSLALKEWERRQAEEALQANMARLIRQESALITLSRKEFLQDGDLLTALRRITEISARTLDVERVSVWRYSQDRSVIRCVDSYELHANRHAAGMELAAADYPAFFQALAERDVIAADDACESQQTREFADGYLKPLGITSKLAAPIHVKGVLDGMLCHEHIGPQRQWTSDERSFAIAVGNSVSLALEEWQLKQAEKAFRQSQQAYAALVNTVDGIVWEADAQTFRFTFVSQMAERLLGYPTANWLNDPNFWQDHLHPEDRDWAVNYCVESTRRKEDHDFRYRMIAADGRVVWVHDLVSVVVQADQPVKLRGIMVDITEQKLAEETLRRQTALFEAQLNSSIDGILVVDNDGKKLLQNQRNREIWKIPREIAENKDDAVQLQFVTDRTKNPQEFIEKVRYLYSHPDETSRDEIELVDCTVLDRYSAPVKDQAGKHYGRIWTFRDITERKLAGEQAQHLANFPELNPNPVLEFTSTGRLVYHNPAALNMAQKVGFPSPTDLLPPGTPQIVAECLSTGQPRLRFETTQNQHTLSWSFYPITTERVVHCYVGDITERKQLEEQFRQSQKMEAIGQLSGGVAHDFNNILCVIIGHASLLQTGKLSPKDLAESAQQIAQSAERAANLTRQLLAFSRRQIMQSRPLDLNETAAGMIKMLQRLIGEHIILQTRYAANDAIVKADPGMIEQVLLNLAVNARDAMPDGGEITIQTEPVHVDAAGSIKHPNGKPGDFIRLSVRDTGCGIPAEHLPRIFEPFFTTKEVGKGTGLGLATVFGIVEQHHGWIEVESEPGRGTTFHIYLPKLKDRARAAGQLAPAPARGDGETILMVEDESTLRVLTRNALERYGYRVIEATSGRAALKVWQQNPGSIQLLLTDLVMPEGISGRDLASLLQAEQPQLKVVYMSGYPGDVAGQGLSLREGVNFLQKPFSPVNLAKIVRAALDAK